MSVDKFLQKYSEQSAKKGSKLFPIPDFEPHRPLIPSKGLIGTFGIELEVEGVNLPTGVTVQRYRGEESGCYWSNKEDGSLRGESWEYVLSAPCTVNELEPTLKDLWGHLSRDNTRVNHSNRTSSHVHINIQGMKINELTSYIVLWSLFETALVQWCGEGRTSNHFCLGNKDTNYWLPRTWTQALETNGFNWGENNSKYSALNLACLNTLGSFEFRCMRGIDSPEQIIEWCKILYALREAAKDEYRIPSFVARRVSELNAANLFRDILTRYGKVNPEVIERVIGYEEAFNKDCMDNLRECQSIIYAFNWREWEEEFYKEYVENPFTAKKKKKLVRHADVPMQWRVELDRAGRIINQPAIDAVNPVPFEDDE